MFNSTFCQSKTVSPVFVLCVHTFLIRKLSQGTNKWTGFVYVQHMT